MGRQESEVVGGDARCAAASPSAGRTTRSLTIFVGVTLCVVGALPIASSRAARAHQVRARLTRRSSSLVGGRGSKWLTDGSRWLSKESATHGRAGATGAFSPGAGTTGTISGNVTSAATNAPIEGVEVCAFTTGGEPFFEECAPTGVTGEYSLSALPAGEYDVEFFPPDETGPGYVAQYYNDKAAESEANPVVVSSSTTKSGISAALRVGGRIDGQVIAAATKAGLAGVLVCAFDEATETGRCALTEASGLYTVPGLAAGGYKVAFLPPEGYALQFYNDKANASEANPVPVVGESTSVGIDAALQPDGSGLPVALSDPTIVGQAVQGDTLSVLHATWTNSPTAFRDDWGRCSPTGLIETCFTISTGTSYTLTPADVGHTIRVREKAINGAGEGPSAFSAPTAIVSAAPLPPEGVLSVFPIGGGPSAPAPVVASSGVQSSTSSAPNASQLRSLLAHLLAPSGRNAKIGALLKHGGFVYSFNALSAGQLSVSWYFLPKGAHLARAKPVLAASGKVSSASAGAAKLTLKLTAKGRGLLVRATRLNLTAKGVLATQEEAAVGETKPFTLKR
jgi:hypothetical protein